MFYKNTSYSAKTFYGVTFNPGETKEVGGYINNKWMIPADDPATKETKESQKKPSSETAKKEAPKEEKKPQESQPAEEQAPSDKEQKS